MIYVIQPAGRSSLSTDHEDQSGVSDEGYIMDMSLVAKLIDNFDKPGRKKGLSGQLSDFYAPVKLENITREKFRKLPSCLDMANLGMYCCLLGHLLCPSSPSLPPSLNSSLISESVDAGSHL